MEVKASSPANQGNNSSYREIFEFFWRLRWWIILCAVLCLAAGVLYVRMQTPMYKQSTWIMLNKNDGSNSEMTMMAEFTGRTLTKRIDNEVFIIKTPSMMRKVVEELELNKRYFHYSLPVADRLKVGRQFFDVKKQEYYPSAPFSLVMEESALLPEDMKTVSVNLEFRHGKNNTFKIETMSVGGKKVVPGKKFYQYGEFIDIEGGRVTVELDSPSEMIEGDRYACNWSSSQATAASFIGRLSVDVQGQKMDQSDVVSVSFTDAKVARARDVLNTLVAKVNDEARSYTNVAAISTIEFIDQRLSSIAKDLNRAETDYKQYQSNNAVVNLESQSQLTISSDKQYQDQLNEVRLQLQVLAMISEYLNSTANGGYSVIPANIGISDAGLNSVIASYNNMVAERNRMVANSSETNPRVLGINTQLNDQKKSIEVSVANLVRVYKIREQELEKTISAGKRRMTNIPQQQFELQQLGRKLEIVEPLYLMLQQKREEAQIKMYSQIDNFRILETAFGSTAPVSPNSRQILLVALLLGCCIPPAWVWARMQLRTKIETKKDISDKVNAPIIAVLPRSKNTDTVLIPKNGRDNCTESFRMLRSNLQYLKDAHVIQLTSSVPGEGKSYIAANLALSLAHLGKHVLLIGLDLRKPALHKIFGKDKVNKADTVVGYLVGKTSLGDDLIYHSEADKHLDIIFAGPVPPNPTELIASGDIKGMIEFYRRSYDYVIIDSAPYLPVSDSFMINPYVDATLYVIRANYTDLKLLTDINEAFNNPSRPVRNVSIILNDLDVEARKYHYGYGSGYGYGYGGRRHGYGYGYGHGYGYGYGHGYGYGYGHGYGYGYGYGYGEDESVRKKSFLERMAFWKKDKKTSNSETESES